MAERSKTNNYTTESVTIFNTTARPLSLTLQAIVSDDSLKIIQFVLILGVGIFLSVLGTASNIINAVVYYKQGVKESATVAYFILSFWDAALCFLTLLSITFLTIEKNFPVPEIDFYSVQFIYVAYSRSVTHMLSTTLTVYLSVELCLCITIPLKVKLIFTKTRSILINLAMFVFAVACHCPVWATQGLTWKFYPGFNRTRLGAWFAKDRQIVDTFYSIFTGNVIPILAQTISIASAALLISGIKNSIKFRQQAFHSTTTGNDDSDPAADGRSMSINAGKKKNNSKKSKRDPNDKYTKLAKITVLITIIFLVCNVPVICVSLFRTIVPELTPNDNLFIMLYTVVYMSTLINSNASIFVYIKGSTKFRRIFLSMFCGEQISNMNCAAKCKRP